MVGLFVLVLILGVLLSNPQFREKAKLQERLKLPGWPKWWRRRPLFVLVYCGIWLFSLLCVGYALLFSNSSEYSRSLQELSDEYGLWFCFWVMLCIVLQGIGVVLLFLLKKESFWLLVVGPIIGLLASSMLPAKQFNFGLVMGGIVIHSAVVIYVKKLVNRGVLT